MWYFAAAVARRSPLTSPPPSQMLFYQRKEKNRCRPTRKLHVCPLRTRSPRPCVDHCRACPAEGRAVVEALLKPETLAIIAGTLVVWAGSHFLGVGEIVDVILLARIFHESRSAEPP
jgi:hypothetical protein